ncbi:MAG: methionyl-tRNA formyltransferase, partial [Clostridia bacterium]|nr:methionyl-tRNA formyltransferase [Clostridia bacterium]
MKIVFMGTPDFSAVVLEKLNSVYPVSAVVTGLDKPVGRGYQLKPSPAKVKAEELGIPVLQYEKVSREGIEDIRALEPDVIVTAAFGQILSTAFLEIPKFAVLNVHASLLPAYRGSSP